MGTVNTTRVRRWVERTANEKGVEIAWLKDQIDAALQSIEDWFDLPATKAGISNAIDNATAFSFSVTEKKHLVRHWLQDKADREGGLL